MDHYLISKPSPEVIAAAQMLAQAGQISGIDPGFRVSQYTFTGEKPILIYAGWDVTNEESNPLTIRSVNLNGEYSAPIAAKVSGTVTVDTSRQYPINLTIGQTETIYQYNLNDQTGSYSKDVIFIDFDTDRGKFRFRPPMHFEKIN